MVKTMWRKGKGKKEKKKNSERDAPPQKVLPDPIQPVVEDKVEKEEATMVEEEKIVETDEEIDLVSGSMGKRRERENQHPMLS
ncbi:unnamed protein product [Arabis nemorensis]|uniref:Uncharacterized protein n=1 Tax=Arabis nemorensis TaxID=586526 RepID=A0A565CBQ2_9BRAS|nr:unnamed protein product [Arabis nemorensis]